MSNPGKEVEKNNLLTPIIEVASKRMRKLSDQEASSLDLPQSGDRLITSGTKTLPDGRRETAYIIRTGEGSTFEMGGDHPLIAEIQFRAAGAAIDAFEAQSPIQTAGAIKRAIQDYGYRFEGGPIQALEFTIEALRKMVEFQTVQLQLDQLNTVQAATKQLREDQDLPIHKWLLLPTHRQRAAIILTEVGLAAAVQSFISPETVEAAKSMKNIDLTFDEISQERAKAWVGSKTDILFQTGDKAKKFLGEVLSQAGTNSAEFAKILLAVVFGDELAEDGVIKATLERSGDAGQKLLGLISDSGLTIHEFLRGLWKGEDKSGNNQK